jgi:hypothetical protein
MILPAAHGRSQIVGSSKSDPNQLGVTIAVFWAKGEKKERLKFYVM